MIDRELFLVRIRTRVRTRRTRIIIIIIILVRFVLLCFPVLDFLGELVIIRNFASIVVGQRSVTGYVLAVVPVGNNLPTLPHSHVVKFLELGETPVLRLVDVLAPREFHLGTTKGLNCELLTVFTSAN